MRKSATWFLAALATVSATGIASDVNRESVPFTLEAGHLIVVQGAIGPLEGLNLVIDTGASSVVVSREVAKKLGLKGGAKQVLTYGRKAKVGTVELPVVKMGALRFDNVPAQVGALSLRGMDRRVRIDALIGLELMRRTGLSIDYESRRIHFGPATHSDSFFPFYGKLPIVTAPMTVRGRRIRLLLDTGAEHVILFQRNVEGRIAMKRTGEKLPIRYMGGKARLSGVRLTEVTMGETLWNELPAYLLDGPSPYDHLDGVLGTASLGLKRLNLDFENGRISWIVQPPNLGPGLCSSAIGPSDTGKDPPPAMEVDFQLVRDYIIVVKGSVGHLQDLNFLVDTASVPSVISSRLARKLDLRGESASLSVFSKTVDVKKVVLPQLSLGPIRLGDHPVLVQDFDFIERGIGVRVDAMIGLDVLGWSNFAIDYEARKLLFGVRVTRDEGVPFEVGPGCMLLAVKILGRHSRLVIDTGTSALMFFDDGFREDFPELETSGQRRFANFGGSALLDEVELPELLIGKTDFGPRSAVLIPRDGRPGASFDGLLGLRSLGACQVYFDFDHQRMRWTNIR